MLTFKLPTIANQGYGFYRVENKLEDLQKAVGGYIEMVPLTKTLVMLIDEEGKMKNKRKNMLANIILDHFYPNAKNDIVGTALLVGNASNDFTNLSMVDYKLIMQILEERGL